MSKRKKYNPEKRAWKGRSYKKGGTRVKTLKYAVEVQRVISERVVIEIEAKDEDEASEKALELVMDPDDAGALDWDFLDESPEVVNIDKL